MPSYALGYLLSKKDSDTALMLCAIALVERFCCPTQPKASSICCEGDFVLLAVGDDRVAGQQAVVI
jgi:hypothetical protein